MCGIAGIINKDSSAVNESEIINMTRVAAHRGPDGEGFYTGPGFAFGHRRLSIQDLSNAGHQPMVSDDSNVVLTYNGEIYNYLEIRQELIQLGYSFHSECDTEVLLNAYIEWGESCVEHFNGMWAFALYDAKRETIFCSRDRFGVKPFYYCDTNKQFLFASEIKQLAVILQNLQADERAVKDFLLTKIADADDATFFKDIYRLPSGSNLIFNLKSGKYETERFYKLKKRFGPMSPESVVEVYTELFNSSIDLRLRSDVKVGTCLSGGLDSSSVATIAANKYHSLGNAEFNAVTAISTQKSNDESGFARLVAESSDINWIPVTPTYDDFVQAIPEVVYAQEEPFGSPSLIMQHYVMKTAKEHGLIVLLDGQGGDESLLGYEKYYAASIVDIYKNDGILKSLISIRNTLKNNHNMSLGRLGKYLIAGLSAKLRYKYYSMQHDYLLEIPKRPWHLDAFSKALLDVFRLQKLENTATNLPVLLRYEDKSSMSHSIETRLPFLDYRLMEFALSAPTSLKINNGWSKWLLRKSMDQELPESICWRRDKKGFEAPEIQWLTQHVDIMRTAVMKSPLLASMCDLTRLEKRFDRLDMRSKWRLYSVALWEETYRIVV